MSSPRFYIGQLDQATFTMTEAESPSSPLSNLKTYFANYQWMGSSKAINQRLILDWGEARQCDFAIFENHNFATVGADAVVLQAADDGAFTTGLITLSSALASLSSPGKVEFTAQTKRYWSVLYQKSSGELAALPHLGQMFVNKKFEVLAGYNHGYRSGNQEFRTFTKRNLNGIELAHQNFDGRVIFEFQFSLQSDDFKTNWVALCNSARGRMNPFYYYDPAGDAWYVRLTEDYNPVRTLAANNHATEMVKLRDLRAVAQEGGFGKHFGKKFGRH